MDNYNTKQVLTELFQMILTDIEIDDEIIDIIENFFVEILDSNDNSIFEKEQLYNFLYLLEYKNIETPLLKFLINELRIKSLRVSMLKEYNRCLEHVEHAADNKNCPIKTKTKKNYQQSKKIKQEPQNLEVGLDVIPVYKIFEKNFKLTENEL